VVVVVAVPTSEGGVWKLEGLTVCLGV
jgi:hypothetical protein